MAKKDTKNEGPKEVLQSKDEINNKQKTEGGEEDDDDEDDEEDEDYDPEKKQPDEEPVSEDEDEDDGGKSSKIPDYSTIESNTSQVRTRSQRINAKISKQTKFIGNFEVDSKTGLVKEQSELDIDSIFDSLKNAKLTEDLPKSGQEDAKQETSKEEPTATVNGKDSLGPKQIKIQINYTFAGKLITETKMVDENSQEAKAYLNSTSSISSATLDNDTPYRRTHVNVFRTDHVTKETKELRIKLKRPSLIDRFLEVNGNAKKMKLSTLEKSRLDWASFVDKRKINEELKTHNKGGYLDKQAFIERMNVKQDDLYLQAKEEEKRRKQQMLSK
ncbi:SWR1-complex protein 5 [Candida viswanathii]|uniref:SWR1-complex protein 5 n=1 Tax=Candida viswanathii TaxID=5486 RepID=A0A367YIM4_9ASCO|nr:SWR1-complex protein 5 [Candida viswanathii]